MKKLFGSTIFLVAVLLSWNIGAQLNQPVVIQLWDEATLTQSTTTDTRAVDLSGKVEDGFFAIQYDLSGSTGTPTIAFSYLASIDGSNFVTPASASDIATGRTKATQTSGKDLVSFAPEPCKWIKIRATESAGAAAKCDLWLIVW